MKLKYGIYDGMKLYIKVIPEMIQTLHSTLDFSLFQDVEEGKFHLPFSAKGV